MTWFSSLLPPKAKFVWLLHLSVGEEAFTVLIYSFYKGDSLSLYFVFMPFYSPANTSGVRLLVCR